MRIGKKSRECLGASIKKQTSNELSARVNKLIKKAHSDDMQAWTLVNNLLIELHLRAWSKTHTKELELFRKAILKKTNCCFVIPFYSLEVVGMKVHESSSKVLHPYPLTELTLKMIEKWEKTKSDKSLEEYIQARLSKKEKKEFFRQNVTYLSPQEQKLHEVIFKQGKMRINHKRPAGGMYIFALSGDGKRLLAGQKNKGYFQHTSFFGGEPVQCAGKFEVKHAKIKKAILFSGHYRPNEEHGKNLQKFLKNQPSFGKRRVKQLPIEHH